MAGTGRHCGATMTLRESMDPELSTLRSYCRSIPDIRERHAAEAARWHVFTSLEINNPGEARRWLTALEAALITSLVPMPVAAASAILAIDSALREVDA